MHFTEFLAVMAKLGLSPAAISPRGTVDSVQGVDSGGYGSDDGDADVAPCPCAMGGMDDELFDCRAACQSWPGPVCGMCFASSCACGYVFDDAALAAARDPRGRLICHACVAWSGLG